MKKNKILITAAGSSGGMALIKALSYKPDIELFLCDAEKYSGGFVQEISHKNFVVPMGDNPEYAEKILNICLDNKIDIIYPVADEEITSLSNKYQKFIDNDIQIIMSDKSAIDFADDKGDTALCAQKLGIPIPKTYIPDSIDEIENFDIEFPAVVKPAIGRGAIGVEYVYNINELKIKYKEITDKFGKTIIQEFIPGKAGSIYLFAGLFDKAGKLRSTYCSRSLKTKFEHGGPAVAGEPLENKKLLNYGKRLLLESKQNWFGPINVEFKRDERDGEFKLLEINARFWGYGLLCVGAGLNYPYYAIKFLLDEPVEIPKDYRKDILLVRTTEDKIISKGLLNNIHEYC